MIASALNTAAQPGPAGQAQGCGPRDGKQECAAFEGPTQVLGGSVQVMATKRVAGSCLSTKSSGHRRQQGMGWIEAWTRGCDAERTERLEKQVPLD